MRYDGPPLISKTLEDCGESVLTADVSVLVISLCVCHSHGNSRLAENTDVNVAGIK